MTPPPSARRSRPPQTGGKTGSQTGAQTGAQTGTQTGRTAGSRVGERPLAERLEGRGAGPDLRDRTELLTDRIVAEMDRTVPSFLHAPDAFRAVVPLVVGRIVTQVLTLFVELRPPSRHEVRDLVDVCVPATGQGVTLEDMLGVFRIAQDVLWSELHRATDEDAVTDPLIALELSHVGVTLITELSRGVTAEYLRGDRVWLQRRDAERALIRGVLDAPPRIEDATRAAHALDLRLFGAWRCAVYELVDATKDLPDPAALVQALEDARATWGVRGAITAEADVVLLMTQGDDALAPPAGVRVGIGNVGEGAQGMRTSHAEALDALAVAQRRDLPSLTADEARLGRVLLGSLSPTELADAVLAAIDAEPEARRQMLHETLEAWLDAQGSATVTARRLRLHVQSTRYRITQLRTVLGDALDDPDQRLQLHLAVRARALR
ncbi:MAG: hypothetical protein ACI970_001477 [Myxococcota bacterium]